MCLSDLLKTSDRVRRIGKCEFWNAGLYCFNFLELIILIFYQSESTSFLFTIISVLLFCYSFITVFKCV